MTELLIFKLIIHQIFSLAHDWSKRVTWLLFPAKTGEYPRIFPNFHNCPHCSKDLKDNKRNSLHLGRKYAHIFVLGHYLFLVAHSFPRAMLSEQIMSKDKYPSIFSPQMKAIVYILRFTWCLNKIRGKIRLEPQQERSFLGV